MRDAKYDGVQIVFHGDQAQLGPSTRSTATSRLQRSHAVEPGHRALPCAVTPAPFEGSLGAIRQRE